MPFSKYVGICRQWRPRSACAARQSDQRLHCPQILKNVWMRAKAHQRFVSDDLNLLFCACLKALFTWHSSFHYLYYLQYQEPFKVKWCLWGICGHRRFRSAYAAYQCFPCGLKESEVRAEHTVFTLSIRTPQLLTIYVLKFEPVQFTTRCCV